VWDPYSDSKLAMLIHAHYINLQATVRHTGRWSNKLTSCLTTRVAPLGVGLTPVVPVCAQSGDVLAVAVNPGAVYSEIWRFLPQVGSSANGFHRPKLLLTRERLGRSESRIPFPPTMLPGLSQLGGVHVCVLVCSWCMTSFWSP
jgi:hypothetical protein